MLKKTRNIIFGYILSLIWISFIGYFFSIIGYDQGTEESDEAFSLYYSLFIYCIWAPLWEEALYRYGPITIAKGIGNQYVMPVVIMSSCLFGWGHGESHDGVLIQGVLGLIFSIVYIKNNYSYFSSVVLHSVYNLTLLFLNF